VLLCPAKFEFPGVEYDHRTQALEHRRVAGPHLFSYRTHFELFIGIFALPNLLVLAYQCVGLTFQSSKPQLAHILITAVWSIWAAVLSLAVSAASQAATVVAVSHVYLDRPASVMDSFEKVKGQILGVVGL
jgi:hypothetical protein